MEIVAQPLEWKLNDEQNWAAFLDTPTGRRLIPKLVESTPALLATGDTNAILIRSGEVRGMTLVIQTLLSLTHSEPMPVTSPNAYPDLEDDKQWADGKKLGPTPEPPVNPDPMAEFLK